jgi:hypothetical protein
MSHSKLEQSKQFMSSTGTLHLDDINGHFQLGIRFDGCVNIDCYYNTPFEDFENQRTGDRDYMHICDLDAFITMLTEARDKANEHFGTWPL